MATRKLFKVSKEFNLGKDTLTNFLEKLVEDGKAKITFKGPNTVISDEIYSVISEKYSREKEQAVHINKQRKQRHDENEISSIDEMKVEKKAQENSTETTSDEQRVVKKVVLASEEDDTPSSVKKQASKEEEKTKKAEEKAPAAETKEQKPSAEAPKPSEKQETESKKLTQTRDNNRQGGGYNRDNRGGQGDRPAYNRDNNRQGGGGYNRDNNRQGGGGYNRDNRGGQGDRPAYNRDNNRQGGGYNRDNRGGQGDRPAYNRDNNRQGGGGYNRDNRGGQGDRPAYNRDNNRQGGGYNRDNRGGQGDRPAYNRDNNRQGGGYNRDNRGGQGDRPAYNRDNNRQGGGGYNRDNRGGQGDRPSYNRDGNRQSGGYNRDNRGGQGDRPSYNRGGGQGGGFNKPQGDRPVFSASTQPEQKDRPTINKVVPKKTMSPKATSEAEKQKKKREAMQKLKKKGKDTGLSSLDRIISNEEGANYRKKRKQKKATDTASAQANVKSILHEQTKKKRKKVKKKQDDGTEIEVNVIQINEFMSTQDLANLMEVPVAEIITKCLMDLKLMVNINQRLDLDTIRLLAEEYGFEIEEEEEFGSEFLEDELSTDETQYDMISRAPIITVMGHVDHGKTSLLDYIRQENIVAGESGGITQHIGAYEVTTKSGHEITFLDTPGHEAFTAMRARGAQATDVVILIVSADDGVMPQTKEAIDHAKAAGVPFVVAITKVDKPDSNPDRVVQMLSEYDVLVEDWGGQIQCQRVSSKTGEGVDELLEKLLIEAEVLELQAAPDRKSRGTVVESKVEKGKGTVSTVLVQDGTLRVGDDIIVGPYSGRVKSMHDERGNVVEEAGPSTPVQITGINDGVPQAGDRLIQLESASQAKDISRKRQQIRREQDFRQIKQVTLDDISRDISLGGVQELNLLVKGDVDGSVEALSDSLIKLSHDEVRVKIIRKAVGPITESDVVLAAASGAIIIGFHVRPVPTAASLAEKEKVEIRNYRIVYDAINEIRDALEGMLRPEIRETIVGQAEVREIYKISKIGNIAGCMVTKDRIKRDNHVRVIREGVEVFEGKLSSLKRFTDDVKDVVEGFDCGLQIENYNDIRKGDVLEFYEQTEIARKLEDAKKK